jgi:hypothetical protein
MTAEQFRTVRNASPFRPFTIRIAGGKSYTVAHWDFVSQSPGGRTIIVYHAGESFSIVDLGLVTELEVRDQTPSEGQAP